MTNENNQKQIHRIRLRGPWTKSFEGGNPLRITVPETEPLGGELRSARYLRKFNCPTGLSPNTRVWLVIDSWIGQLVRISINETVPVGPSTCGRGNETAKHDLTDHLQPHNELVIELHPTDDQPPQLVGEVYLSIVENSE